VSSKAACNSSGNIKLKIWLASSNSFSLLDVITILVFSLLKFLNVDEQLVINKKKALPTWFFWFGLWSYYRFSILSYLL
jgi:hypothetical protein